MTSDGGSEEPLDDGRRPRAAWDTAGGSSPAAAKYQHHYLHATSAASASLPQCLQSLSQLPASTALPYFYAHDNPHDEFYNVPAVVHEMVTALSRRVRVLEEQQEEAHHVMESMRGHVEGVVNLVNSHRPNTADGTTRVSTSNGEGPKWDSVHQRIDLTESRMTALATMISAVETRVSSLHEQQLHFSRDLQSAVVIQSDAANSALRQRQVQLESAVEECQRSLAKHRSHLKALLKTKEHGSDPPVTPSPARPYDDATPMRHQPTEQGATVTCSHGTLLQLAEALRRRPHEVTPEVLSPAAFVATEVDLLIRAHVAEELARCDVASVSRRSASAETATVTRAVEDVQAQVRRLLGTVEDNAQRIESLSAAARSPSQASASTPPRPVETAASAAVSTEVLHQIQQDTATYATSLVESKIQHALSRLQAAQVARDEALHRRFEEVETGLAKTVTKATVQKLVTSAQDTLMHVITENRDTQDTQTSSLAARMDALEANLRRQTSANAAELQSLRSITNEAADAAQQALHRSAARSSVVATPVVLTEPQSSPVPQVNATTAAAVAHLTKEVADANTVARDALDAVAILQAQYATVTTHVGALHESIRRLDAKHVALESKTSRSADDVEDRLADVARAASNAEAEARTLQVQLRSQSRSSTPVVQPIVAPMPLNATLSHKDRMEMTASLRAELQSDLRALVEDVVRTQARHAANSSTTISDAATRSPVGDWVQAADFEHVIQSLQQSSMNAYAQLSNDVLALQREVNRLSSAHATAPGLGTGVATLASTAVQQDVVLTSVDLDRAQAAWQSKLELVAAELRREVAAMQQQGGVATHASPSDAERTTKEVAAALDELQKRVVRLEEAQRVAHDTHFRSEPESNDTLRKEIQQQHASFSAELLGLRQVVDNIDVARQVTASVESEYRQWSADLQALVNRVSQLETGSAQRSADSVQRSDVAALSYRLKAVQLAVEERHAIAFASLRADVTVAMEEVASRTVTRATSSIVEDAVTRSTHALERWQMELPAPFTRDEGARLVQDAVAAVAERVTTLRADVLRWSTALAAQTFDSVASAEHDHRCSLLALESSFRETLSHSFDATSQSLATLHYQDAEMQSLREAVNTLQHFFWLSRENNTTNIDVEVKSSDVWPSGFRAALSSFVTEATREALALRAWATPLNAGGATAFPPVGEAASSFPAVSMPTLQEATATSTASSGVMAPMSPRDGGRSPHAAGQSAAAPDALSGSGSSAGAAQSWLEDVVGRITSDLAFQFAERFSVYEVSLKEHDEQLREDLRTEFDDLEQRLDAGLRGLRLTLSQRLDDKADRSVVESVRRDVLKRLELETDHLRNAMSSLRTLAVQQATSHHHAVQQLEVGTTAEMAF